MKNDTYLNPLQRDYKSEDCNLNSVKREEHVYMELFTIADSRTSLQHVQSGINENEPGAGGELNNINSAIGKPRGSRNRSKIIIAVLVVVTMVAVAVAIFMAIAAAKKDESSDNPDDPSDTQNVKGRTTIRGTPLSTSSLLATTSKTTTSPPTTTITSTTATISTMSMVTPTMTAQTITMITPTALSTSTTTPHQQSTEPQTIKQQCTNGATLIPHPSECQLFYDCSEGWSWYWPHEQYLEECPYPTQFNTETMKCEDFEKVDCGKRKDTKAACQYLAISCQNSLCEPCEREFPSCLNKTDGADVDDLYPWSPYYIMCYKERFVSKEECPRDVTGNRKYFHPDMKVCVPLDMVPQERGGTMPKCEGREDGNYFDDLGRCSQFTVCASGAIAEIIKCKEGEVYDPFPQKCVEEAEACEPCGKMNICLPCLNKTDGANVNEWPWAPDYIMCYKERLVSEEECPRNDTGHWMRFHPDMRECVPLDMVPQEHGGRMPKCEGREDGNYRDDKGRCNQFTVCVSGAVAEIIKCKDGEVYDTLPQKCVEEAEACEPCGEMNRC